MILHYHLFLFYYFFLNLYYFFYSLFYLFFLLLLQMKNSHLIHHFLLFPFPFLFSFPYPFSSYLSSFFCLHLKNLHRYFLFSFYQNHFFYWNNKHQKKLTHKLHPSYHLNKHHHQKNSLNLLIQFCFSMKNIFFFRL